MKTIYQCAQEAIGLEISRYLELVEVSDAFANIQVSHIHDFDTAVLFAAGIDSIIPNKNSDFADYLVSEFKRKSAVQFDVENAVCVGVYHKIRPHAKALYDKANEITVGFQEFSGEIIKSHPYLLPVFQNILKYSKAQLRKKVGSASDTSIAGPASVKLAELLLTAIEESDYEERRVLQRMEVTLEGIVRDLVGRILFEEIVAHALDKQDVEYLREEEYSAISGVVYDFRSDFVLPNPENPIAFIEVRKSSSRHASLYAKDKMFSAINWKGKHKNLIGVIIVEGDWTQATLKTMAKVFDYVVPLSKSAELAKVLKRAQDGDENILRWLIEFRITTSPNFTDQGMA